MADVFRTGMASAVAFSLLFQPAAAGQARGSTVSTAVTAPLPSLPGDDQLTCPQILAEAQARSREFDALTAEADRLKVPMSERTMALLAAHEAIATAAAFGPPGSEPVGGAATAGATAAYMESAWADAHKASKPIEQRIEFAMARGDYLNELHQKKCLVKTVRTGPRPANCPKTKAEIDRLRKEMDAGNAEIMALARSYNPAQSMAGARAASTVGNLASALLPGLGGLISSGTSAATSAAQQAQFNALNAKASATAQRLAEVGERIAKLETEYEEKCAR